MHHLTRASSDLVQNNERCSLWPADLLPQDLLAKILATQALPEILISFLHLRHQTLHMLVWRSSLRESKHEPLLCASNQNENDSS